MKRVKFLLSLIFAFLLCFSLGSCWLTAPDDDSSNNGSGNSSGNESASGSQSADLEKYWYKGTTFYHIWIKSFCDTDNDGIGDLNGIKSKLDYINDTLGCDGIWLSPVFECEGTGYYMHGYDTKDYYGVNSKFGTKDELASLITACHEKGMKIIFDFVPNHSSPSCAWFVNSKNKSTVNGVDYTDWYVWSSSEKSVSTNMSSSRYYYDSTRGEYFYGAFGSGMPDLNYSNAAVRNEMKNVIKYWMDFGFDGMRVDAVRYLYDDVSASDYMDSSKAHEIYAEWRTLLDSYESPKFMMCEAWIESSDRSILETYLGSTAAPEFNMVLDFNQGRPCYTSVQNNSDYFNFGTTFKANSASSVTGAGYASFLTNHDEYTDRIGTVFNGDQYAISLSTALSLMRANVPVIYYGQEIGMKNQEGVSGDTALRGFFDWSAESTQASSTASILKLNNALLKVRKNYKSVFANGSVTKLNSSDSSKLAYTISDGSTTILCVYNLSSSGSASVSFTGALGTVTSYSTLIGDIDDSSLSVNSGNVTVTNLAPYAYRVYLLGDSSASNIYDNETYSETHDVNLRTSYDHMYLRGSMNSWGADEMTPDESNSIFTLSKYLDGGIYNFKFCTTNSSWDGTQWGSPFNYIYYDANTVVNLTGSKDVYITINEAGTYTIKFDSYYGTVVFLSAGTSEDTAKENTVYLRGGFSNWKSYGGIPMAKQSDGSYSVSFTPDAGDYQFKISKDNDSWDTQWGSADSISITLGTASSTSGSSSSGNFSVTLESKNTTFTLYTDTNTIKVSQ